MSSARILLVEDDADYGNSLAVILNCKGYKATFVTSAAAALAKLKDGVFDLVISDVVMPGMSGLEFLQSVAREYPALPVIMLTAYGSIKEAVEATKAGAFGYFLKSVNQDEIFLTIENALDHARLKEENLRLRQEIRDLKGHLLPSRNENMKKLMAEAAALAQSDVSVLLTGESGTGKEVVARFIHENSPRAKKPFVPINCQAYVETLVESELFGYKPHSFTGASAKGKQGKLEAVNGGTLFLDEIGELNMATQVKLLRVIENREIEPIGSIKPLPVNFRLISATNKDLKEAMTKDMFREDLYYRISTVTLRLPALRERPEDILPFAGYFLRLFTAEQKKPVQRFTAAAERLLAEYPWPGNIRELRNVVEGAVALCRTPRIDDADLRLGVFARSGGFDPECTYKDALNRFEKGFFAYHYENCGGNISKIARSIKMDRKQLYKRLAFCGIIPPKEEP
jgi:two-component system response regulator HydG